LRTLLSLLKPLRLYISRTLLWAGRDGDIHYALLYALTV
jgi:hypothetical protein